MLGVLITGMCQNRDLTENGARFLLVSFPPKRIDTTQQFAQPRNLWTPELSVKVPAEMSAEIPKISGETTHTHGPRFLVVPSLAPPKGARFFGGTLRPPSPPGLRRAPGCGWWPLLRSAPCRRPLGPWDPGTLGAGLAFLRELGKTGQRGSKTGRSRQNRKEKSRSPRCRPLFCRELLPSPGFLWLV